MSDDLKVKVSGVGKILNDASRPLKERFRALFTLRNIGGEEAISEIGRCFDDNSSLLKHELAYCLGQMGDPKAIPILTQLLQDTKRETIVRHEAGEALGAIGAEEALPVLQEFLTDPIREVSETCHLAVKRIKWLKEEGSNNNKGLFLSTDPAPPMDKSLDVNDLEQVFLDEEADLFERYRAMFKLRDMNTRESILILCKGLFTGGVLFRHEVAFVLGQLQNPTSIDALIEVLEDPNQNEIVRHESAEALGSIATEKCIEVLKKYQSDPCQVVKESCDVALDMAEYELSSDFQYANTASVITV